MDLNDDADLLLDLVARWHSGEGAGLPLHEYLGLTRDEYAAWAEQRVSDEVTTAVIRSRRPMAQEAAQEATSGPDITRVE